VGFSNAGIMGTALRGRYLSFLSEFVENSILAKLQQHGVAGLSGSVA
jgi:hypothetical protein